MSNNTQLILEIDRLRKALAKAESRIILLQAQLESRDELVNNYSETINILNTMLALKKREIDIVASMEPQNVEIVNETFIIENNNDQISTPVVVRPSSPRNLGLTPRSPTCGCNVPVSPPPNEPVRPLIPRRSQGSIKPTRTRFISDNKQMTTPIVVPSQVSTPFVIRPGSIQ